MSSVTPPTLLWAGAALVLLAATLVGARLLARRTAGPVEVRVVGDVPPVTDWLPAGLHRFAARYPGATVSFADRMDQGVLRGHRAVVSLPLADVELYLRMQPHLVRQTRTSANPLTIRIQFVEAPTRSGFSRLIFGRVPSSTALDVRSRLQDAIRTEARNRGLSATAVRPMRGTAVAVLGAILVALALVVGLVGPVDRLLGALVTQPSPTPVSAWYPTGAAACPAPSTRPGRGPTASAAARGTSCAYAEAVRAAYARARATGPTVKLGGIRYDHATLLVTTCTVGKRYVTCRGGTKEVYLAR